MRLALIPSTALAFSLILTYATYSNVAVATFQAQLRSSTGNLDDTPPARWRGSSASTEEEEERMPSALSAITEKIKSFAAKVVGFFRAKKWVMNAKSRDEVLDRFHPSTADVDSPYQLAQNFWDQLSRSNLEALMRFYKTMNRKDPEKTVVLVEALSTKYGVAPTAEVLLKARVSGNKFRAAVATEMLEHQLEGWYDSGKSVDEVFRLLDLQSDKDLASLRLQLLQDYIDFFNIQKSTKHRLLGTLIKGFGSVAKLSPILAMAKASPPHPGDLATRLQDEMARGWIARGLTVENVISSLQLSNEQFFRYEYRDALTTFIEKLPPARRKLVDLNNILRKKYGNDGKFADAIMRAMGDKDTEMIARGIEDWLFQQWWNKFGVETGDIIDNLMVRGGISLQKALFIAEKRFDAWHPPSSSS
uniref:RxLR effector candidate protein n=1 Tax=Peronospora matthiolae TaxID=2874970 RepID=A0AAV1U6Q0_9STRA